MTAAFDLYTKRARLYYITLSISIATLVVCFLAWLTNPQLPRFLIILCDVFIFIGGLTPGNGLRKNMPMLFIIPFNIISPRLLFPLFQNV